MLPNRTNASTAATSTLTSMPFVEAATRNENATRKKIVSKSNISPRNPRSTGEADVVILGPCAPSPVRCSTGALQAGPFLPWILRLFGAKFGKGVFMDMTDLTEFDCVKVGQRLGDLAVLETFRRVDDFHFQIAVASIVEVYRGDPRCRPRRGDD